MFAAGDCSLTSCLEPLGFPEPAHIDGHLYSPFIYSFVRVLEVLAADVLGERRELLCSSWWLQRQSRLCVSWTGAEAHTLPNRIPFVVRCRHGQCS